MNTSPAALDPQSIPLLYQQATRAVGEFPPPWVYHTVFYQVFLDRFANGDPANDPPATSPWGGRPDRESFFGGDLQGLLDRLDYLSELGVGGIYLNPIFLAPSNHKYDTQDYLLIDPHFGGLKLFCRLLDEAHARGIRVMLDGVFNHTGDRFWAFQHVMRLGSASPYADWYYCREFPLRQEPQPNYECWWGFASLPKLRIENPEVLAYLTRVITFWTSLGIDGWRLDVPNEVAPFFWRYFRQLVKEINPQAYLVGEIWDDGRPWLAGDMFDTVMNYQWRDYAVRFLAKGEIDQASFLDGLADLRARYPEEVALGLFNLLGSHDTERFLSLAGEDKRRLKLATLFQFAYPGVPVIYYGDEAGLTGGKDPDCRRTMPWDPAAGDRDLLLHYQRLGRIRRDCPALATGGLQEVHRDDAAATWAFIREAEGERVMAVFNFSGHDRTVSLHPPYRGEDGWEDLLRGGFHEAGPGAPLLVKLPALAGTILKAR